MDVRDFVKENKDIYLPKTSPVIVDVPEMVFLMIDGAGAPDPDEGSSGHKNEFQAAMGALYGLVYSVKMSPKKNAALKAFYNFKVAPPEGLWWMKSGKAFDMRKRNEWRWTLMIRVPEFVTQKIVYGYVNELVAKKKNEVYRKVRLEKFREGLSVQLMHIGSYASEGPNIERMHVFAKEQGYKLTGKHHEIYFGDPRRSAPEKLKTVLRQPVAK